MTSVTLNGNEYSADGSAPRDMLNGGHRSWFIPALVDMLAETGIAVSAKDDAEAARDLSQNYAAALTGTSSTSITVATGGLTITASTGKQWIAGQYVYVARTSAPTTFLAARVIAYNPGTGSLQLDVTATGGSGTATDWTISIGGAQGPSGTINSLTESVKSAAYTAVSGDKGKVLRLSGTWTLALTAAATLGNGWWAWVSNEGTGVITVDPSSTQQIDGLTTLAMYGGEVRLVWCTGTLFRSVVVSPFRAVYTASGTFIDPPGYSRIAVRGWGAGGGGAKLTTGASGGGGGACMEADYVPAAGTSRTITIGAGGAATTTNSTGGGAGGDSSFGSLFTFPGGLGGSASASPVAGGSVLPYVSGAYGGGLPSSGSQNVIWGGGGGRRGVVDSSGFSSWHGGGGGGAGATSAATAAGTSVSGGNGGDGGDTASGANGTAPAGGGGGTRTGATSGAGARGEMHIWGVC